MAKIDVNDPLFPLVPKEGYIMQPPNIILQLISAVLMYGLLFLFMFADLVASFFQFVYFNSFKIPKVKRAEYIIVFDRTKLSKLNPMQKIACAYCGYANGVISYIKAILVQVEIYSCAIKHKVEPKGQAHINQFGYYDYEKYE